MRLYPSFGLFLAILSFVALSTADETNQTDNIPSSIRGKVPDCIKTCLENFIASSYPETCTGLDCMCRTKTPSTLTLGEAAASCYYALCSSGTHISNDLYQACDSVSNHLPNTHATLTATTFAAPTTTKPVPVPDTTTTKEPESTKTTHTEPLKTTLASETSISPEITYLHTTSTNEPTPAPQTSQAPQTFGTSSSSTPTPSPSNSTVPAGGKKDSSSVSSGTVIGVSVASGIAGTFIVGVAVFFLCRKWRNRRQTGDFEIGGVMTEPSNFSNDSRQSLHGPGPNYPPGGGRGQQEMSQNAHSPRVAAWVAQSPPTIKIVSDGQSPQRTRDIGLAVGSDADWETSPRTADSLSELVPKSAGLYPKPLQWFRPDSWQTVFEEDEAQSKNRSKGKQPEYQPSQQSTPDPQNRTRATGLPSNPRALKNGFQADQFRRATNQTRSNGSPTPHGTPYIQSKKLGSPFTGTALRASPNLVNISGPKSSPDSPHIPSDPSNPSNTTISSSSIQGIGISGRISPNKGLPANPKPSRNPSDPTQEVVSKPRIVRGDDIKRVEPGDRSRPPSEVVAPYCPDDLWLERSRKIASRRFSTELPYPSELTPGTVVYPSSPKKQAQDASRRMSPSGRNLTPSRRGDDLYLSVD